MPVIRLLPRFGVNLYRGRKCAERCEFFKHAGNGLQRLLALSATLLSEMLRHEPIGARQIACFISYADNRLHGHPPHVSTYFGGRRGGCCPPPNFPYIFPIGCAQIPYLVSTGCAGVSCGLVVVVLPVGRGALPYPPTLP